MTFDELTEKMKILETEEQDVLFYVGTQAGTYIRKLCHDIGKKLETGAHMAQLIRTKVGIFTNKNWHSLQDLKDAYEFYKDGDEKEIKEKPKKKKKLSSGE